MTDHELDEGLRAWYRREVGEHERAPSALRVGVSAIPRTVPVKARFENRRTVLLAAAAILAALLIGGAITVGSGILRLGTIQPSPSVPGPSPAAVPTASRQRRSPRHGPRPEPWLRSAAAVYRPRCSLTAGCSLPGEPEPSPLRRNSLTQAPDDGPRLEGWSSTAWGRRRRSCVTAGS
jgi:hypothetical protein